MSRKTAPVNFFFSKPDLIVSTTLRSWCDVERLGRKPCCSGMIKLIESTWWYILVSIIFSATLPRTERSAIGRIYLLSLGLSQALGWRVCNGLAFVSVAISNFGRAIMGRNLGHFLPEIPDGIPKGAILSF
ncbi:hypothetical protein TNCV_2195801 [Trichonephila clavipes]|nr:hypothetical protein TNCV_2195801 [Trichonephila clavipes]